MSGSKKKKARAPSKEENGESSAERGDRAASKRDDATPAAIPTGVRRWFLLSSFGFLFATGMPWDRRSSPIQWIAGWVAHSDWSDRALALHMAIPLLMLVAVASRETAPRVWPRMSVASLGFFAMASFAIVTFGDSLPPRPQDGAGPFYQDIPRVIRSYAGWATYAVRALTFVPAALVAGWALAAKGSDRAPIANRILLALATASTVLIWAPRRMAFGYWLAAAMSLALLVLAPLVKDEPEALDERARKKITAASVLWFVAFAAIALTRSRRF
jgi:hypothetical protein